MKTSTKIIDIAEDYGLYVTCKAINPHRTVQDVLNELSMEQIAVMNWIIDESIKERKNTND